jgi:hypothetical protein
MRRFPVLLCSLLLLFVIGCGVTYAPGHNPNDPMKVTITSSQDSVLPGGTVQLTATVTGDGPTTVQWTVNGLLGGSSTYGTVSTSGLFTAPDAVPPDPSIVITATSLANTSVSASFAILIMAPTITSVAVACNPTSILTTGMSTCSATVDGTGNYNPAVTWTATDGTMTPAGAFVPSGPGIATITATSVQDATRTGTATVTIAIPIRVTSVAVVCDPASILTTGISGCSATVNGTGSYNPAVRWTATNGTITSTGVFTPSGPGNTTVTATSLQDASKSGTATVIVATPITITSVVALCNPASILTTGTSSCSATVHGTGSFNPAVTWSAAGGAITSGGVFTPSGAGNSTVTATSVQDVTRVGLTTVTVALPPTITSVSVTCVPSQILVSQTSICTVNVTGAGAYNPSVTWSVDNGVIDQSGTYQAPTSPVTATIRAVSNQDSTKYGTATVTVNPAPTITGVTLSCSSLVVPVGQTSQCTASVQGTGAITQDVVWEVNGEEGGDGTIGTISSSGLYQAPTTAPNPYVVIVTAASVEDATKSAWVSIRIQGPISSGTQTIGPAGGTVTLADGNSVTIPAGVLQTDTAVTLSSSSVSVQPTSTLFQGISPSLTLSFNPALTATGLVQRQRRLLSGAKPSDSSSSSSSELTFIVTGDPTSSTAQIQGAFGVLNVNDGANNFFAVPSTYNATLNQTLLTVDPSLIEANSTIQIGLTDLYQRATTASGNATLQIWDGSKFVYAAGTCPKAGRVLVMVNGMLSSPQGTFTPQAPIVPSNSDGAAQAAAASSNPQYDAVVGISYTWLDSIDYSAQSMAAILDSIAGPECGMMSFDIEAHSEGVVVSMASMGYVQATTANKLAHFVSIAGPIDGTPLAEDGDLFLTVLLNTVTDTTDPLDAAALSLLDSGDFYGFISDLRPNSTEIIKAKSAISENYSTNFYAFAGNVSNIDITIPWWVVSVNDSGLFSGEQNDGVIPVVSALAQDTSPVFTIHSPYSYDHTHLVDNPVVVLCVLAALSGQACGFTLSASPSAFSVTAGSGGNFQLTATSNGGFSGTATISSFGSGGISGSCSPASFSFSSSNPGTTNCSFTTSTSTPGQSYTINISSTSSLPNPVTTTIAVVVTASSGQAGYTATMGGSGQSIDAGSSAQFLLTATSVNGFSNTVSLPQATMNISGASSSWSPSSISISPSSQGASTLTVNTNANTPEGTYLIVEYMPDGQSPSVTLTIKSGSSGGNQAPTATTGSASASTNSATLYGTVNPNGFDTHFYFEYGTSNTLSTYSSTGTQDLGSGSSTSGINANIASLSAGTQYYFRVVAYNINGTTMGLIVPFSTTSAQIGPTAHFTMTGLGQTFSDGQTLPLTLAAGTMALISTASTSTTGSAPITTYLWTFNGTPQCGNSPTCNDNIEAGAASGTVSITLTVTDSNGKQSPPATGTVFVTVPTATLSVTDTTCHGSVAEIDLSFTVSGGTSNNFDIYRDGTLLYSDNSGATFMNYGPGLAPGQTFSYYVVVHLTGGGTATSNTVFAVAPTNCH